MVGRGEKSISNEPRHDNKSLFFCAVNIHVDLIKGGGGWAGEEWVKKCIILSLITAWSPSSAFFPSRLPCTYKSICGCKSSMLDICQTVCLNKLAYALDRLLNIHFEHFPGMSLSRQFFPTLGNFWRLGWNHCKYGRLQMRFNGKCFRTVKWLFNSNNNKQTVADWPT